MFPVVLAVSHKIRNRYMGEAVRHDFDRLKTQPAKDGRLSIVCYGPTLKDTWREIRRPILTCSGAHNFLLERGVVPDYHVDCDPRPHKVLMTSRPHRECVYIMASCCDPQTWTNLRGHKVLLWHMDNGPETRRWVEENDPYSVLVGTGSTVGLRALHIGGMLGWSKFDAYGWDGNFVGEDFRAGPSNAPAQNIIYYKIDGRVFKTTDLMVSAMKETRGAILNYRIDLKLHGDGMTKAYLEWFRKRGDKKNGLRIHNQARLEQ